MDSDQHKTLEGPGWDGAGMMKEEPDPNRSGGEHVSCPFWEELSQVQREKAEHQTKSPWNDLYSEYLFIVAHPYVCLLLF